MLYDYWSPGEREEKTLVVVCKKRGGRLNLLRQHGLLSERARADPVCPGYSVLGSRSSALGLETRDPDVVALGDVWFCF